LVWVVGGSVSIMRVVLDWQKFLGFVFIPHAFAAWGIIVINFVQHDGCDETHPYNHSRNIVGDTVNWFLFNNGDHGIHHMKPGLHWSKLPEAHAELVAPHIHPNLDQPSLFKYCWKAYVSPGKRVDYLGRPLELPPAVPDAAWIPGPRDTPTNVSLGAES